MGLLPSSSGRVKIFGRPVKEMLTGRSALSVNRWIGTSVNVMDVVLMGRHGSWFGAPEVRIGKSRGPAWKGVKMLPFAERQIANSAAASSSGSSFARALAQESDLYFMDEPLRPMRRESAIIDLAHEPARAAAPSSWSITIYRRPGIISTCCSC